jgi:hypothetical protein
VIVAPPSYEGAVHATVTDVALTTVAIPIVGAPGPLGVTALDALDKLDVPAEFRAVNLKKYGVPFVKGEITHELAIAPVAEI